MSRTITLIKDTLSRKFKGASIDDVEGISDYSVFREAAGRLTKKIDPIETVRRGTLTMFEDVYDYSIPADLKKVIDIRPQVGRVTSDNYSRTYIEDLDRDKSNMTFSVEYDNGTKFMRVVDNTLSKSIPVDETLDDNWTAGTGASNIAEDTVLYSEGARSLRFDISSGTSFMNWNGASTVDLSEHQEKSSFFKWIYFPDSSIVTSVTLLVGSDGSNYWEMTGQIHFGSIKSGWNLYRFDWDGATETGTVVETAIDFVQMQFVTTSADTDIRMGQLISRMPYIHDVIYYSRYIFKKKSDSSWTGTPESLDDTMILEEDAENIFVYECCEIIAGDSQDEGEENKFNKLLHGDGNEVGLYAEYEADQPSQAMKPQTRYYRQHKRHKQGR